MTCNLVMTINAVSMFRRGSQIRSQLSVASPTNRPHPKVIITIVIIKLKLWPAAGCEAEVAAELSSHPLIKLSYLLKQKSGRRDHSMIFKYTHNL